MAIMKRCLCFSNVRSGSLASAFYTILYCVINVGLWGSMLASLLKDASDQMDPVNGAVLKSVKASSFINIAVAGLLLIVSVQLFFGIVNEKKALLIPYMIAMVLLILLQLVAWIMIFVLYGLQGAELIAAFVIWLIGTALNIICLLCVISQYQELRDGRGKANPYGIPTGQSEAAAEPNL